MTVATPDFLPTLSAGAHNPSSGHACVMEYVSLLAGEQWTDRPRCTNPILAAYARLVNDMLEDKNRHHLVPLIGRLFGTAETGTLTEARALITKLGIWSMRYFMGGSSMHAFMRPEDLLHQLMVSDKNARNVSEISTDAYGNDVARVIFDYLIYPQVRGRNIVVEKTNLDGTIEFNVEPVDNTENELCLVKFLTELIDEYDRLTGRTEHRELATDDLKALADQLVPA